MLAPSDASRNPTLLDWQPWMLNSRRALAGAGAGGGREGWGGGGNGRGDAGGGLARAAEIVARRHRLVQDPRGAEPPADRFRGTRFHNVT